jgi:pimeloyl-ACP methyl ester carboxylesterase
MGGAICFKLSIRHPERYSGVIFLSPALKDNK